MLAGTVLLAGPAHADLPEPVALALKQAGIPDSHVGVVVQDLDAATPLLTHGAGRSLNPASVMKLVTTLAALDILGPAHTFKTRVWLDGRLEGDVLHGNLVLQGGGDPGLTQERFWLLLRELRLRGIREIRGDVLLDNAYYNLEPIDPAAFDQAPLRPYNAPPAALLVNFNTLELRLGANANADAVGARLEPAPAAGVPTLVNQLQAAEGPCNGWRDAVTPRHENGSLILAGRYPMACGDQAIALNLLAPEATVASLFRAQWLASGGTHTGAVLTGAARPEARLLLEYESPPLTTLVRDINKFSNNVMAKMLFLNLGAQRFGAPATWDKGVRAIRAWLAERGLNPPELVLENGSGLSRIERISADSLTRLLRLAASKPVYYEFAASLPALALEGTQKRRQASANAAPPNGITGMAWLKTGTLNGVRNLAGYVLGADGRRRSLVMLINHANSGAAGKVQDALLEWSIHTAGRAPTAPGTPMEMEIKQ